MSSFDDTNEMKSFVKKAMSIPLLEENHEKVLAKKWIKNKEVILLHPQQKVDNGSNVC